MAKRKKSTIMEAPSAYREPTSKQEMDWAMDRAVEKAVLAHPRTQKLREAIKQRMVKATGCGEEGSPAKKTNRGRKMT